MLEHIARRPGDVQPDDIHSNGKASRIYLSMALLYTGRIDQARACTEATLQDMRGDPSLTLLGFGLVGGGISNSIVLRDVAAAERYIDELQALIEKGEYILYRPWVLIGSGWRETHQGRPEIGLQKIREGLKAAGGKLEQMGNPFLLVTAAETLALLGYRAEGEKLLDQVLAAFRSSFQVNALYPYVTCLKGQFLLDRSDFEGSASAYREAFQVARQQEARLLELLAATGLCRLKLAAGQPEEGLRLLRSVYDCFTEGFDTAPLLEAKALLG